MASPFDRVNRSLGRLTVLLTVVFLPPAVALVWLGLNLLAQERDLQRQREADRREAVAEAVTRTLLQSLTEIERALDGVALQAGIVRLTMGQSGVVVAPPGALAWVPVPAVLPEYASAPFEAAEREEFADRGDRGRSVYHSLAASTDSRVRTGALVRRARLARRENRLEEALTAYRELAKETGVTVNGMPADLVGRRMICDTLRTMGGGPALVAEVGALRGDFAAGKWLLDRTSWEVAAADIAALTGSADAFAPPRALSSAADAFHAARAEATASAHGRSVVVADGRSVTLLWRRTQAETVVLMVPPASVLAWVEELPGRDPLSPVQVSVFTDRGDIVAGPAAADERGAAVPSIRLAAETGLPWNLRIAVAPSAAARRQLAVRQRLLTGSLVALVALIAAGGYLVWRVVRREVEIARLQTDFVAAVSHEFRTPLTSLRHVTELLQESDDMPAARRQSFYAVLAQSGDRLHRLVETLLDFARMEAGRHPWQLRPLDARELLQAAAAEFGTTHPDRVLEVSIDADAAAKVLADRDAMMQALANLLDNAVKYSPDGGRIGLRLARTASAVTITVTDEGLGIPPGEVATIPGRFVRGRQATERRIKGTGLGLALVAHIVQAHAGRLEIASREGRGSSFTLVLPAGADAAALPSPVAATVDAPHPHR